MQTMRFFVVLMLSVLAVALAHSKSKSNSKSTTISKTLNKAELPSNLRGSNTEMQCITEQTYTNYSDQQCADVCNVTSVKTKCNSYEVKCVQGGDCTCYLYKCSPVSF